MRRHVLILPVLVLAVLIQPGAAEDRFRDPTVQWVVRALEAELWTGAPDLNKLSSLLTPLASVNPKAAAPVLDRTADYLRARAQTETACDALPDILLAAAFLARTGRPVDVTAAGTAFRSCGPGTSPFDIANALEFFCRYTDEDPRARVPGGIEEVLKRQRADGAFAGPDGKPHFYFTTHAVLALHDCGAAPGAVARGQAWMRAALPRAARSGFLDGLAELLVFLAWMDAWGPDWAAYADRLLSRANPDGGLCFRRTPGCRSHWHATSVLLELKSLRRR